MLSQHCANCIGTLSFPMAKNYKNVCDRIDMQTHASQPSLDLLTDFGADSSGPFSM